MEQPIHGHGARSAVRVQLYGNSSRNSTVNSCNSASGLGIPPITPGYAVVVESMYSCILTVQQLQKLQNY